MKKTRMLNRLLMVAIPLGLAAPAWAIVLPCPVFPITAAISTLANPCGSGNLQFSNFVVGTTTDTIDGIALSATSEVNTPPDATTVFMGASPGGDLHFSTGAVPPCAHGTWCVSGKNQVLSSTVSYEISTINGAASISEFDLTGTLHSHANFTSAVLFAEICPNATVFSQGCTGYQVSKLGQINGHNITVTNGGFTFLFAGVNKVAVRETVYLTTANGTGSDAEVNAFEAAAPEPATLGMVGLALAGLGAARFRKRKL